MGISYRVCMYVCLRSEPAFAFFSVVAQKPEFMESGASAELQTRPHSMLMSHLSDFVVYTKQPTDDPSAADGETPAEFVPLCAVGEWGSETMLACKTRYCEVIMQQSTVLRAVACDRDGAVEPSAVETRFFPVRAFPPQVRRARASGSQPDVHTYRTLATLLPPTRQWYTWLRLAPESGFAWWTYGDAGPGDDGIVAVRRGRDGSTSGACGGVCHVSHRVPRGACGCGRAAGLVGA